MALNQLQPNPNANPNQNENPNPNPNGLEICSFWRGRSKVLITIAILFIILVSFTYIRD